MGTLTPPTRPVRTPAPPPLPAPAMKQGYKAVPLGSPTDDPENPPSYVDVTLSTSNLAPPRASRWKTPCQVLSFILLVKLLLALMTWNLVLEYRVGRALWARERHGHTMPHDRPHKFHMLPHGVPMRFKATFLHKWAMAPPTNPAHPLREPGQPMPETEQPVHHNIP